MMAVILKLIGRGFRDFGQHPWAQLLTLAAVTLVTFLSGLFLLGFSNLNKELNVVRGDVVYQVFWRADTGMDLVRSRWDEMRHLPWLVEMRTYTPEEALKSLMEHARAAEGKGGRQLTSHSGWLKERNPLPPTAMLRFAPRDPDTETWMRETREYLENLPSVENVRANPLRDDLARAWNAFAGVIMWPVIGFLGFVLALVVGNTIKLSLISRRDEIDILQLVGARNWFIRLPLLISGALQGAVGGICALCLLWVAWYALKDVLNFSPLFVELSFLPFEQSVLLVAVPALVGFVSSWLAVRN
ncbi:cell division protein FtsX [Desulfovibrio psychrotolerans]|uniref:Cell division protein FtsX n=1 Tax=Desulfovibrio psychrotolerans TaxID=415242 RepID=A0A7J0BZK7_9BACT|nr:FtsX-like permease family protein [Desulfovibrio psychrotolerans]GFM38612.1 cell division protein FtsX [Desulfovibrio psychrotolerans]